MKDNQRKWASIFIIIVILCPLYLIYQQFSATRIVKYIYSDNYSGFGAASNAEHFKIKVNALTKTISLYPDQTETKRWGKELSNYHTNQSSYYAHIQGENDKAGELGNSDATKNYIEPMCNAIGSSNTKVRHYKVNVYFNLDGQTRLLYSYKDGVYTEKPEYYLDPEIYDELNAKQRVVSDFSEAIIKAYS